MNSMTVLRIGVLLWLMIRIVSADSSNTLTKEYWGPIGLRWGLNIPVSDSIAKSRLSFLYSFEENGDSIYRYKGAFGGFDNTQIDLMFHKSQLFIVAVNILEYTNASISKTWFRVVDKTTKKHGTACKISLPPKGMKETLALTGEYYPTTKNSAKIKELLSVASAGMNNYTYLDLGIKNGDWSPYAAWKFKNSGITVAALPSPSNENELTVIWIFGEKGSVLKWQARNDSIESANSDF